MAKNRVVFKKIQREMGRLGRKYDETQCMGQLDVVCKNCMWEG
jgi:hypothetical protein